jgi:hypothetical protein
MEQVKSRLFSINAGLLNKFNGNKFAILYLLLGAITLAHLCIFIQYPFAPEISIFTALGEKLKAILPAILLITLLPMVYKTVDKVINTTVVNVVSLAFITLCVIYQIANVSGQAWSTVAFSGALILLLFNHTLTRYKISKTVALVFSFMVVWLGWVVFETIYQIGLWYYHPLAFGNNSENYYRVIITMVQWMIPALLYIFCVIAEKKAILPKMRVSNYKYFIAFIGVCIIATSIWYSNGMLIPVPFDANDTPYLLELNYLTREHLEFSLSRLSQISMMLAVAVLFFRRRQSNESTSNRWLRFLR